MEKVIKLLKGIIAVLILQFKNPNPIKGIKELMELLVAVNEIALFFLKKLMNGFQFTDVTDFIQKITMDDEFKKIIGDAYDKRQEIPGEIKDIDMAEGLEIADKQLDYVPKYIECFKKEDEQKQ